MRHRQFLKPVVDSRRKSHLLHRITTLLLAAAIANLSLVSASSASNGDSPRVPNIVLILADDLGWNDVGYHGSVIKTPNIDKLAVSGTQLNQFYVQSICTPTRAALLTGRYPFRYGLHVEVVRPDSKYGLPISERTLATAIRDAGYSTAICGKWHLGHFQPRYLPTQRGFDHQFGCHLGQIDYFKHTLFGKLDWYRDDKPLSQPGYATELIGEECMRLIERQPAGKPLFLYAAFTAPHVPLQVPPRYFAQYEHIKHEPRGTCAAMVACLDDQVGRIVAALDKKGLRDNTLIIFSSDNGGLDTPRDPRVSDNAPLRDGKYSPYEGGIRAAAFANWPGHIPAGKVLDEPLHIVDLFPTLVNLAGGSLTPTPPLDGLDAWPTITAGAPTPHKNIPLSLFETGGAVRRGKWKLVANGLWGRGAAPDAPRLELYDIPGDMGEKTNLATEQPEVATELVALLKQYHAESVKPLSPLVK